MSDWELMAKYLADECSDVERAEFEKWLSANLENQVEFEAQKALWEEAASEEEHEIDVEAGLQRLHDAMESEDSESGKSFTWFRYAAILALALTALLYVIFQKQDMPQHLVNYGNAPMQVTLPEGSIVWLNEKAELFYQAGIKNEIRKVELIGEAFFDIASDPDHPFTVQSQGTTVTVLGTEFNVDASTETVKVLVVEGLVEFSDNQDPGAGIKLKASEAAKREKGSEEVIKELLADPNDLAWKTGVLRFRDAPLKEVVSRIVDHYKISLELDERLKTCEISTIFDNLSISEVLEVLSLTLDIEVEEKDGTIKLTGTCSQ